MPRYIDADKMLHELSFYADRPTKRAMAMIKTLPEVEVAPVVHGKWIVQEKPVYISSAEHPLSKPTKLYIPDLYTCSMCGRKEPYQEPYCHCGAKMDEKEKEDT